MALPQDCSYQRSQGPRQPWRDWSTAKDSVGKQGTDRVARVGQAAATHTAQDGVKDAPQGREAKAVNSRHGGRGGGGLCAGGCSKERSGRKDSVRKFPDHALL